MKNQWTILWVGILAAGLFPAQVAWPENADERREATPAKGQQYQSETLPRAVIERWKRASNPSHLALGPNAFARRSHDDYVRGNEVLWCTADLAHIFAANLPLEHGSLLTSVDLWYTDNSTDHNIDIHVTRFCFEADGGQPVQSMLATFSSIGAIPVVRHVLIDEIDELIDARLCSYSIQVDLNLCDGGLFTQSSISFHRASVGFYKPSAELFQDRFEQH